MQPPFFCDYGVEHRARRARLLQLQLRRARRLPGAHRRLHAVRPGGADLHADAPDERRRCGGSRSSASRSTIGSDVWVGGGAIILPGVRIGSRAVIGAGSVVTRDIPGRRVRGRQPVPRDPRDHRMTPRHPRAFDRKLVRSEVIRSKVIQSSLNDAEEIALRIFEHDVSRRREVSPRITLRAERHQPFDLHVALIRVEVECSRLRLVRRVGTRFSDTFGERPSGSRSTTQPSLAGSRGTYRNAACQNASIASNSAQAITIEPILMPSNIPATATRPCSSYSASSRRASRAAAGANGRMSVRFRRLDEEAR